MTDSDIDRACFALLTHPDTAALIAWWELGLSNARMGPGRIDPYRLASAQGDRERLLAIRIRAEAHRKTTKDQPTP